jgi:hypothetical protein
MDVAIHQEADFFLELLCLFVTQVNRFIDLFTVLRDELEGKWLIRTDDNGTRRPCLGQLI